MIKHNGESIQLEIVHSVYKSKMEYEKLADGELYPNRKEVLDKQIRVRKWFKKEAITSVEEYVTTKNTIAKNRCIVYDKYSGKFYAAFHHPDDVMSEIEPKPIENKIGFTHDNKIHSSGPQIYQHKKRR